MGGRLHNLRLGSWSDVVLRRVIVVVVAGIYTSGMVHNPQNLASNVEGEELGAWIRILKAKNQAIGFES